MRIRWRASRDAIAFAPRAHGCPQVRLPGDSTAVGVAWEAEAPSNNCSGSCMLRFARVPLSSLAPHA
jgi:hypothetical protein